MDIFSSANETGNTYEYREINTTHTTNLFYQERLARYLGGAPKPYSLPKSSNDKVELEQLDCLNLPPVKPYRPILFYLPDEKITVQRIVGYREIHRKRQRIEYLKLVEGRQLDNEFDSECQCQDNEFPIHHWIPEVAPGGVKDDNNNHPKKAKKKGKKLGGKPGAHDLTKEEGEEEKDHKEAEKETSKKLKKAKEKHEDVVKLGADKAPLSKKELKRLKDKITKKKKELDVLRHEKDIEWLALSESSETTKHEEIDDLRKPLMPWMKKHLSHETQLLNYHLHCYMALAKLMGRKFWYVYPNYETHMIDYNISKKKILVFAVSTLFLWVFLCFTIHSILDIEFGDSKKKEYVNIHYEDIEDIEWKKNRALMYLIVGQSLIVGMWSLVVVLRDGLLISNYLNCWNAALTEMETSGVTGIMEYTSWNLIIFCVYTALLLAGFYFDWPATVRGSSGLVSLLFLRGMFGEIRTAHGDEFFHFQVIGLCFHLYIVYCVRNLFTLLQIMALIMKNGIEMWNLKFGLIFSQFVFYGRGQLLHVKLNHSTLKTFTHHRLLCGLVDQYGIVFAWPIVISVLLQMAIVTRGTVAVMRLKQHTKEDFGGQDYLDYAGQHIKTYNTIAEDSITEAFVLINILIDFLLNTETMSRTCQSFTDSFEFVRRQGTILCKTSHQRRLVQSLEWSMSAASKYLLTANGIFTLTREMIFAAIATSMNFFSLIIQLTERKDLLSIVFTRDCFEKATDRQGYCIFNQTNKEAVSAK